MFQLDLDHFIAQHITRRPASLFEKDLLERHEMLKNRIKGRSVLVVGGAGTIGSSFIKAILPYQPARLFVVDINENGLTELTRDLRSSYGTRVPDIYKTYPVNFGDMVFSKILQEQGPFEIIANFAAHKHVRSEKDHYSIEAMIENNVIRTKRLLDLLLARPPEHFFCVSTDKAANPVNVMGASKKLMEEVLLSYADSLPIKTARFANVAFSNGSLLAGFLERLRKKQPFSSPSDVRRYFVSPSESGQLCLLACILGDSRDIFFPKLQAEQMMTFSSIADRLLQALGLEPEHCSTEEEAKLKAQDWSASSSSYPVYYFATDTSGEKPYEEFYTTTEKVDLESFKALGVIKAEASWMKERINECFYTLNDLFQKKQIEKQDIIALLEQYVPTFSHTETGKSLDQKM